MGDTKGLAKIANDTERFAREMAKNHAEAGPLRARVAELESALTKSASREAALVEKLKVAEAALVEMLSAERMTNRPPETVMDAEAKLDRIRLAASQCVTALAKIKEAS